MNKPTPAPTKTAANVKSKTKEIDLSKAPLYKCHKEVHALPMTRGEYNIYRGWELPKDENPMDDGYLVVYAKGTEDHYESWSPKKQFDEGYALPKKMDVESSKDLPTEIKVFGNPDTWRLICKASGPNWMKSTKAMEIKNMGCIVQVTTEIDGQVAEALTFVERVRIGGTDEKPELVY